MLQRLVPEIARLVFATPLPYGAANLKAMKCVSVGLDSNTTIMPRSHKAWTRNASFARSCCANKKTAADSFGRDSQKLVPSSPPTAPEACTRRAEAQELARLWQDHSYLKSREAHL